MPATCGGLWGLQGLPGCWCDAKATQIAFKDRWASKQSVGQTMRTNKALKRIEDQKQGHPSGSDPTAAAAAIASIKIRFTLPRGVWATCISLIRRRWRNRLKLDATWVAYVPRGLRRTLRTGPAQLWGQPHLWQPTEPPPPGWVLPLPRRTCNETTC